LPNVPQPHFHDAFSCRVVADGGHECGMFTALMSEKAARLFPIKRNSRAA